VGNCSQFSIKSSKRIGEEWTESNNNNCKAHLTILIAVHFKLTEKIMFIAAFFYFK